MMSLIMLNNLLGSQIKHADCFIISASKNALICWMKVSISNCSLEAIISLNLFLLFHIPYYQALILTTWAYQSHILIHLSAIDPVVMTKERPFEFLCISIPHFEAFIVTCRKKSFSISKKTNWFHSASMSFDYFCLCAGTRIP